MSDKVQVQKNSSAPSQMAPSPQFQQRPFTDERYQPVASTETVTADSPPNIARASFNLLNMSIFAPSPGANVGEAGIQRQEEEQEKEPENSPELQTKTTGIIQAKCSQCEAEEKEEKEKGESIQPKLTVGKPGDKYEQEADSMAAKVMAMPDAAVGQSIQRQTDDDEKKEIQTSPLANSITPLVQRSPNSTAQSPANIESSLANSKGGGSPLPDEVRNFMEPRFGADFSGVRVHTGSEAVQMNRELGAQAFTHGSDIYYGGGKTPGNNDLTAHELTHLVQQGAAPSTQHQSMNENGTQSVHTYELYRRMSDYVVQRFPGDGMVPPGDCDWATYLLLRGSVETAKAVVSTLGACSAGDSCLFLATKIAAISAEIAARLALDTTCFKGGDTGHRQQVQDKINMMNRCYRFFSGSNCSPELITAMAVVVERAREVIAAAAVTVAIALVIALIAAIIALAEVIAALAVAVAESAAIGATAAAVIALLVTVRESLSSEES